MIKGDKVSGYGITLDEKGKRIVQEFRQCSHCQYSWPYQPGSGRKYGMCTYCVGLLCTKCLAITWKKVSNKCVPFSEGIAYDTKDYILDENTGIFLRK